MRLARISHRTLRKECGLILLLTLLTACHKPSPLQRIEKSVMQMPLCVQVDTGCEVEGIIERTFEEIDQIYNNWNPNSEISRVNRQPGHAPIELSAELASFLHWIDSLVTLTEGRFDPTVEPLCHFWKQGMAPPPELLKTIGWQTLSLAGTILTKSYSETAIDLGGIAKGYAVDLLASRLKAAGCKHVYVAWGGEIRTLGSHPNHRPWRIGIRGADVIEMEDEAIATSGDYLQQWSLGEITYCHIIDPRTKLPLEVLPSSIRSASVVMESCALADALATALMLFPSADLAEQWLSEHFPLAQGYFIENASSL